MTVLSRTCFEPLFEDDVTEQPLTSLLQCELRDATMNGLEVAALVGAILLWQGTPLWLTVAATAGAVVLGIVVHQLVLIVSVLGLRRWRGSDAGPTGG